MSLVTASKINSNWFQNCKKQIVPEKCMHALSETKFKVQVRTLQRDTKEGFFIMFCSAVT